MDPLIENLKSTTFCGKRLTRRQIADIQETVGLFPKLSRTELGHTICEHLGWQTPKGSNRIQLATRVLEELERLGILTLPARSAKPGRGPQRPITPGERTAPQPAVRLRHPPPGVPRRLDRLAGPGAPQAPRPGRRPLPVPLVPLGAGQVPGVEGAGAGSRFRSVPSWMHGTADWPCMRRSVRCRCGARMFSGVTCESAGWSISR